jgi:hypothetical protein
VEFKDLFKKYEPPPGGLEALRIKLAGREKVRRKKSIFLRPAYWAFASAAVVIVLIAVIFFIQIFIQSLLPGKPWAEKDSFSRLVAQSDDPSLIRYGLVKVPEEAVTVPKKSQTQLAVLQVPVESEDVIFYWVSSLPTAEEMDE